MAIADLLSLIDHKLEEIFHHKPRDATKARGFVRNRISRTREQFAQTEPVKGRKWINVANGVIAFSPTRKDGVPLEIDGKTTNYISVERFGDFLKHFEDAVNGGEFDDALEAQSGTTKIVGVEPARKSTNGVTRVWTDERRQRF